MPKEPLYIAHVYVWQNGMVMVFDQFGQQMPEYQGRKDDVWHKIMRDRRTDTAFNNNVVWNSGVEVTG